MKFLCGSELNYLMNNGLKHCFLKNIFKKQPVETGCANDYKRIVLYQTILFLLP